MSKEAMLTAEVAVLTEMVRVLSAKVEQQEQDEPVSIKHMREWIVALKRRSDNGEHMTIDSGISAGTCWELAVELEQFINTTPQQRKPLTNKQLFEHWQVAKVIDMTACEIDIDDYVLIARDVEALHGIKE